MSVVIVSVCAEKNSAIQEIVLVVEDDILIRMPIAQYLRDCGYKVIEAANSEMTVLSDKEIAIKIVLTDIETPGVVDGFGLAKWIREHRPGVEVLLAGTVPRALANAKDLCEKGPIPKPYDHQFVSSHIRRLLAAREERFLTHPSEHRTGELGRYSRSVSSSYSSFSRSNRSL